MCALLLIILLFYGTFLSNRRHAKILILVHLFLHSKANRSRRSPLAVWPTPYGISFLIHLLCLLPNALASLKNIFTQEVYTRISERYGDAASREISHWSELLDELETDEIDEKLYSVNRFFNRLDFVSDIDHWKISDYWATPIEFIATGAGDCEDYAIAKYFSLIELGIPESKLRLMYVTALRLKQPHMVLAYYDTPTSVPLVLDNINKRILPASKRRDLAPIYSFNGNGLWAAKAMGNGRKLRGGGSMKMWDDMIARLDEVIEGK